LELRNHFAGAAHNGHQRRSRSWASNGRRRTRDGEPSEPRGEFKREKSSLKELLLKKKEKRKTQMGSTAIPSPKDDPVTAEGLPAAQDPDSVEVELGTVRGMPAIKSEASEEE
jgi:hypothetical protein